jgi:hypothetical protein
MFAWHKREAAFIALLRMLISQLGMLSTVGPLDDFSTLH